MRQIYNKEGGRMESPTYIKALVKPNGRKPTGRRVWSIDLETVWLPFLTATNTMGDTVIPHEALGAPLRLAYNADGSVKFTKTGRPMVKVAKEVQDTVKMVRENFVAGLLSYANGVVAEMPDAYKAEVEANRQAGMPIADKDRQALELLALAMAEARAEPKAEPKAEAEREPEAEAETQPKAKARVKEPVTA